MKAKICYYKDIDPRINQKLRKLWFDLRNEEKDRVFLQKGFFDKNWVELPFKENVALKTLRNDLESIFSKYNMDGSNPVATDKGQNFLKRSGLHHTSMSVGDVVKVDNRYFVVAGEGFKRLVLTKG